VVQRPVGSVKSQVRITIARGRKTVTGTGTVTAIEIESADGIVSVKKGTTKIATARMGTSIRQGGIIPRIQTTMGGEIIAIMAESGTGIGTGTIGTEKEIVLGMDTGQHMDETTSEVGIEKGTEMNDEEGKGGHRSTTTGRTLGIP
jgi:hypothetical protein